MATFTQTQSTETLPASFALSDPLAVSPATTAIPVQPYTDAGHNIGDAAGTLTKVENRAVVVKTFPGEEVAQSSGGFDWFEDFHVLPRSFDFGNLLSSQSTPIEVFCAFRRGQHEWSSFINGAGAGVSLGSAPSLPTQVDALSGVPMTLDVSANGDPFVDATLDFIFNGVGTAMVPIEIQRIVLWGLTPEKQYAEELEFLTEIQTSKDGTEKRPSVRDKPRQSWFYKFIIEEGTQAQVLENLMFDFQSRVFGVPVHGEDSTTTTATAAAATTIDVDDTAWRDYRVGGLAVIMTSQSVFDVLEIVTINATSLDLASPTINAYAVGSKVFPLATCTAPGKISGDRFPVGLQRLGIKFTATDSDVDLADLSPFSSYNSKLLLDVGNSMVAGNIRQDFTRELVRLDGGAGQVFQDSNWDRNKRAHKFTMRASGRQAIWEMRGLAYALRGRQISFYVPRDSDDLVVVADLLNASNTMDVENVGYAQFVRNRQPKNVIRVNFADGSTPLVRAITGSSSTSTTVDQLVVDVNWPSTITPAEISRVEYVEKVRFDTDKIRLEYDSSGQTARMVVPIVAVFE